MLVERMRVQGMVKATVTELDAKGVAMLNDVLALEKGGSITRDRAKEMKRRIRKGHGHIKLFPRTWWQKLWGLPARPMVATNHNIVTNEGDDMIADILQETPERTKVDNTNGHIEVGTGFVSEVKTATSCTTPTDDPEVMDATYPVTKGDWGVANGNVVQYRATFEAGDLNASGIDEAALMNNAVAASGDCLAYAEITPAVNVTTADTLQVDWEITFLGA